VNIYDSFWDTFDLLPLTPEAQAGKDHFDRYAADAFDAAWERACMRRQSADS
jgi:hypothetical protein